MAALNQFPCTLIKGISDATRPMERKTLLANFGQVSVVLGEWLWKNRLKMEQ